MNQSDNHVNSSNSTFFATTHPTEHFTKDLLLIDSFIEKCKSMNRRVVLITSGGTIVPLEKQVVRFLDNFSAGSRGAISAEYFLRAGFAVIFLHRQYSLQPFARHYRNADVLLLDMFEMENGLLELKPSFRDQLSSDIKDYKMYKYEEQLLLPIHFYTLADYLFLLEAIGKRLAPLGSSVLIYLAAAVSDFYLPDDKLSDHKIQSDDGTLTLRLDPVPKLIRPLVKEWCPQAYIISFKLETDPNLLIPKSRKALDRYRHTAVIANLLSERKKSVLLIRREGVSIAIERKQDGVEIEKEIVDTLIKLYFT